MTLVVPSLQQGIIFVIVLVILGVLYRMLEPQISAPFQQPIRLIVIVLLIVAVLRLFGLI